MVKSAQRTTVEELPDDFLECHELNHAWTFLRDEDPQASRGTIVSYTKAIVCLRCGMERRGDIAVPSMELIGNYRYTPPPGAAYYIKKEKDEPRVTKAAIRAETYKRSRDRLEALAKKAPAKKVVAKKVAKKTTPRTRRATA